MKWKNPWKVQNTHKVQYLNNDAHELGWESRLGILVELSSSGFFLNLINYDGHYYRTGYNSFICSSCHSTLYSNLQKKPSVLIGLLKTCLGLSSPKQGIDMRIIELTSGIDNDINIDKIRSIPIPSHRFCLFSGTAWQRQSNRGRKGIPPAWTRLAHI